MSWGPDSNIQVGTIIVCWKDCGYLKVDAVTPEGLICNCAFGPYLYTWAELDYLWAKVDRVPGSSDYPNAEQHARPPRLGCRGGRVDFDDAVPHIDTDTIDVGARELDLAIMRELAKTAPKHWQHIYFKVKEDELAAPTRTVFYDVTDAAGVSYSIRITESLGELLREQRYGHTNGSWSGFEMTVEKRTQTVGTYEVSFQYSA